MRQSDTLIDSTVGGSVGSIQSQREEPLMSTTPTAVAVPAKWRGQVIYQDMEEMSGGRVKARSFSQYQARSKARREAGAALATEMPEPVDWLPNHPGLPPIPVFDGPAVWEWMGQTGKLPPDPT